MILPSQPCASKPRRLSQTVELPPSTSKSTPAPHTPTPALGLTNACMPGCPLPQALASRGSRPTFVSDLAELKAEPRHQPYTIPPLRIQNSNRLQRRLSKQSPIASHAHRNLDPVNNGLYQNRCSSPQLLQPSPSASRISPSPSVLSACCEPHSRLSAKFSNRGDS